MSKKRTSIIAVSVLTAGLAIGGVTTGVVLANQPLNVTYYANNDTPAITTQVNKCDNLKLPTPTRDGYNFAGWYTDTSLTNQVTKETKLKNNSKLYAGWELANYELASANSEVEPLAETAGLKSIGDYAFANSKLSSITIPDTVTTIGNGAFQNCENLKTVTIGKNVAKIGANCFRDCLKINVINFNASNCSVARTAFEYAGTDQKGIELIFGDDVTSIPAKMFYDGETADVDYIPLNITSVHIGKNIANIESEAFYNCRMLKSVTYTERETGSTTLSIGDSAFRYCTNLQNIYIPEFVTSIGSYAFFNCSSATTINWPINSTLTTINDNAFARCDALTDLTIPDYITTLGNEAFMSCNNLKNIAIGKGVTAINATTFDACYNIEKIIVDSQNTIYKSDNNCLIVKATKTLLKGCKNSIIPEDILYISNKAFAGCDGLKAIYIPSSVTQLSDFIFYTCSRNLKIYCGASSKPKGWGENWNCYGRNILTNTYLCYKDNEQVFWGKTRDDYLAILDF